MLPPFRPSVASRALHQGPVGALSVARPRPSARSSGSSGAFAGVFRGRRVAVTGHTGFKGAWLSLWLHRLGAQVHGYALAPPTTPSLYARTGLAGRLAGERIADVRDPGALRAFLAEARPHTVFHLAAQPLVLEGYSDPLGTFATNVQGTANLLEAVRSTPSVKVVQVVTTDKCYDNDGAGRAFRETDRLGGKDPYSASKAAAELVARAYRDSFLGAAGVSVATARGGNVVGGGDWAANRLVPDLVRSFGSGRPATLRNPAATRPWQHVLDLLSGYLWLAVHQARDPGAASTAWNFGPTARQGIPVRAVAKAAQAAWGPDAPAPVLGRKRGPAEAPTLALDSRKARRELAWKPLLDGEQAVRAAVAWHRAADPLRSARDVAALCDRALAEHEALGRRKGVAWA
jgi:CDP-glucose 4,6-dehydratase